MGRPATSNIRLFQRFQLCWHSQSTLAVFTTSWKKWVTNHPYFRLHTTLVGINTVDTYRLSNFHSILSSNHVVGFRRLAEYRRTIHDDPDLPLVQSEIEKNNYTMRSFAGVLAHQIVKFAEMQLDYSTLRRNIDASSLISCSQSSHAMIQETTHSQSTSSVIHIQESDNEESPILWSSQDTYREVLDTVYDVNGNIHQAVRIGVFHQFHGDNKESLHTCKESPRLCFNHIEKRSKCSSLSNKTRVMCLQCKIPLCYPLRSKSIDKKSISCFANHVHSIPKTVSKVSCKYVRNG